MRKNKNRGFTLIELLIVIAVIGILASLILVGLSSFRARGRDARRIADLKQVQNALELYYAKEGRYPSVSSGSSSSRWQELTSILTGAGIGITQIPQDPMGEAHSYDYGVDSSSNPQSYVLSASLEDPNNSSLKNDIDGFVYGIDCNDPIYCVQF